MEKNKHKEEELRSSKYGECGRHPGNNMVDCIECSMNELTSPKLIKEISDKVKMVREKPLPAEAIFEGVTDIIFYSNGDAEERKAACQYHSQPKTDVEGLREKLDLLEKDLHKLYNSK